MTGSWLVRHREQIWQIGVKHREGLMAQYMKKYRPAERPPLHLVYDELIEEFQEVRVLDGPLPLDRYAQTEVVKRRAVITLNSLIGRMPGVKDEHGVRHVAAWHEGFHALVDVERRDFPPLTDLRSGLEGSSSSPLLCQATTSSLRGWTLREQAIEAAAVADADLERCTSYLKFLRLAGTGGDMGSDGWRLLAAVANAVGVNRTALRRYFEQHGLCRIDMWCDQARLIGTAPSFRGVICLEPVPASQPSVA